MFRVQGTHCLHAIFIDCMHPVGLYSNPSATTSDNLYLNNSNNTGLAVMPPESSSSSNMSVVSENASVDEEARIDDTTTTLPDLDVNLIPAMVYTYVINHADGSSSFPFVSDYCEEMYGFTAQHLMAHPELLMNAVHPDDQPQFTKSVVDSMTNMTIWDFQFRIRVKDGSVKFVHGKSKPRLVERTNSDGTTDTLTKWSGVLFDITAQEAHNEEARKEMRSLMDESMTPIFAIDRAGVVYKWNRVVANLTGYSQEEAIGRPLVELMPLEQRNSMTMLLGSIIRAGEQEVGSCSDGEECVLLTKEQQQEQSQEGASADQQSPQKVVYLYVKCKMRHDSNGEIMGIAFVGQDITKFKEEEKKKEAALKLADAEKGLTEWLSHEVRNPLSIATEAAEALKDDAFYKLPESASHIDLISQSLRYIVELLTDMLDLNKCIEGKITLHPKCCNVREQVLVPTQNMMNVRNKQVQVHVIGGECVTACVDTLRLRQVVTNLVSNSLKFTSTGFIRVSLRKTSGKEGAMGETMLLSVSDSGCGISPAHYDSLFSKWEKLGSTTNGTGIGLCLCQALIRVMGGKISLNREYNSGIEGHPGTEFIIELPVNSLLHKEESHPITTFDAVSRAVVAARTAGGTTNCQNCKSSTSPNDVETAMQEKQGTMHVKGKYHILIVDDDRVGRKFIRRRFQRLFPDAIVEEAVSGEEAIQKSVERDVAYDIITMDHFMGIGDLNGAETIQKLRENKVDALIIGISGNAKQVEHLQAGAENFWQKPIPSDQAILEKLLNHLSPPSGWSVLTVDDVKMNNHFIGRKLRKISSPHFTDMKVAEKRWNITAASTGEEAIRLLKSQAFDLVILDHQLGDGMNGIDVGNFVRKHAVNRDAIVVLNSGSVLRKPEELEKGSPFDLFWPKPLPAADKMRMNLCCQLLSREKREPTKQPPSLCGHKRPHHVVDE